MAAKALPHGLCLSEVKNMAGASGTSRVNTSNSPFNFETVIVFKNASVLVRKAVGQGSVSQGLFFNPVDVF